LYSSSNTKSRALSPAGLCLAALAATAALVPSMSRADDAAPHYAITGVVALGAPDRWDYLYFDTRAKRVYVSHGDQETVVDGRSGKIVGSISDLPGSHGTVTVPGLKRGFSDSAKDKKVVVFDTETLRPLSTAQAGADADGMAYDSASQRVFVGDGDGSDVNIIDAVSGKNVVNLPLGGKPEFLASDGKGNVFINIESTREVAKVDARHATIAARWSIPDCESPYGIAVDPDSDRVFTSCTNSKLFVLDGSNGHIVASLAIGKGSDAVAFDPVHKLVFSSNGEGTLSVIAEKSADEFVLLGNVPTMRGARTMTVDPETGRVFLVTADIDHVDPPKTEGGRPRAVYKPGSVKLYFLDPVH
jgi:DNA-binding beta-propeller fold protein YncE